MRLPWDEIPKTVDIESGCLRWGGTHHSQGYGLWGKEYAHRAAWERENGPIPEGLEIDHVAVRGCRWRDCVLTEHLEPVEHAENNRRSTRIIAQTERTHCPQGHPYEGKNLIIRRGKRECRKCTYERNARNRARRKKEKT